MVSISPRLSEYRREQAGCHDRSEVSALRTVGAEHDSLRRRRPIIAQGAAKQALGKMSPLLFTQPAKGATEQSEEDASRRPSEFRPPPPGAEEKRGRALTQGLLRCALG